MNQVDAAGASTAFVALIPARMASTRLPGKPLADIAGKPMVVRVAERAQAAGAQQVVVACDDTRIAQACAAHGVRALLTRADHASGSDRLAEACTALELPDDAIVVNVQGDEPLIDPALIASCARKLTMQAMLSVQMATAAHPIDSSEDWLNPNVVKVVLDAAGHALYFSRAPIPCWRDAPGGAGTAPSPQAQPLRHVGMYAYRAGFLRRFPSLQAAPIEHCESLEQLRVLWHGERIAVHVCAQAPAPGVDTAADLARVRALWRALPGSG